jgi:hypothetical protein
MMRTCIIKEMEKNNIIRQALRKHMKGKTFYQRNISMNFTTGENDYEKKIFMSRLQKTIDLLN